MIARSLSDARLLRLASYYAIVTAVSLVALKFTIWWQSGALSLLSTLIDSLLDVGLSVLNYFAVRTALIPADSDHRFGHAKAEALAALLQSFFIATASFLLITEAGKRFLQPHEIEAEFLAVMAMVMSILMTLCLVRFQNYVIARTGSLAITADKAHYTTDIAINFSALLAVALVWATGYLWIDALVGGLVAIYLVFCVRNVLQEAIDILLDRELPDEVRNAVAEIIRADAGAKDFHDLRTRRAGPHYFIQFHLELESHLTLAEAHEIADRIEQAIIARFPEAEVAIHQEPAGIDDKRDNF